MIIPVAVLRVIFASGYMAAWGTRVEVIMMIMRPCYLLLWSQSESCGRHVCRSFFLRCPASAVVG